MADCLRLRMGNEHSRMLQHMSNISKSCWLLVLLGIMANPVWACIEGSVRDAAFQNDRDSHRLCVIANAEDPLAAQIHTRLEMWLDRLGNRLNIRLERINADDPSLLWPSLGIPSAPPNMPVVALVGLSPATRYPFVIDHWEPEPSNEDLAILETSPAREAIQHNVGNSWALLLYSAATGSDGRSLKATLAAVVKKWNEKQLLELRCVSFDRTDSRERLLCAFTGIAPAGPDWVGVVFGRGKLMAPPLVGAEINETNLTKLVEGLAVPCTCLQDPTSLGLDIPMLWNSSLDSTVVSIGSALEYDEVPLEERLAALQSDIKDESSSTLYLALIPLLALAVVALSTTVLFILRHAASRIESVEK
jgi:hypothetical protein